MVSRALCSSDSERRPFFEKLKRVSVLLPSKKTTRDAQQNALAPLLEDVKEKLKNCRF